MAELPNHYSSLGLGSQASAKEIREAYRRRVKDCHPDITGNPEGSEDFRAAQEAYEVLSDPEKRRVYDTQRRRTEGNRPSQSEARPKRPRYTRADIDLVLSPEEAARGGRFRIPLSNEGCIFCSSFSGFYSGPCPFCGAVPGRPVEALIDLPPGVAHGTRLVLDRGSSSMLIEVLVEEF